MATDFLLPWEKLGYVRDIDDGTIELDNGEKVRWDFDLVVKDHPEIVYAGTPERLIECLFNEMADHSYIDIFLATHTMFTNSREVINSLAAHYKNVFVDSEYCENPSMEILKKKMKIINVIKKWLVGYPYTFGKDKDTSKAMSKFIQIIDDEQDEKMKNWGEFLRNRWSSFQFIDLDLNYPQSIGVEMLGEIMQQRELRILDFDATELARQLCLKHQKYFKKINAYDIITYLDQNENENNNINPLSDFSGKIQNWVIAEIGLGETQSIRTKILNHIFKLILNLIHYGNFHGAYDVYTGCANFLVDRLKKTWSKAERNKWKSIVTLMSPTYNHNALRSEFGDLDEPALFPLILLCKDMYQLNETDNTWENTKMINFRKLRSYADKIISNVSRGQRISYEFLLVPEYKIFFNKLPLYEEVMLEEIYDQIMDQEKKKKK
eukprot:TRINITY_DN8372_c0_g1_i2.p1 TRINITY_DN8372_c0_g1~~TRINITY_DN8372_c0_g1_i2.p1  ORF type:complete len:436 (-),score=80.29 TRINITY_DN8372_c0_g1_i2:69-1376(-)